MENVDIKAQLDRIESYARLGAKNILTIDDAVLLTGLSKDRLYTLTSQQAIPHYEQGKLYFKRSELEGWLTQHRIPTKAETQSKAMLHSLEHPNN